jgi:hypothetical protein
MKPVKVVLSMAATQSQVELRSIDVDAVFDALRASTSFFRIWNESGDDILTQCPFHGMGNEQHPSFGICHNKANPHYGKYHCFACDAKGTIISLVNYLSDKEANDRYGLEFIRTVSDIEFVDRAGNISLAPREVIKPPEVTEVELMSYRTTSVPYLTEKRRIKPIIQRVFDTGFDPVTNSVTFPVKRPDGSVAFVVRRNIDKKWYNYPLGVDKPVYGVYEFSKIVPRTSLFARKVVLVESIINAQTLWGYGIPAWALLGTGSGVQLDFLNTTDIREFMICLDGDKAGMKGAAKLQNGLKARSSVIPMIPGKDVNDLDEYSMRILYTLKR